MNPMLLNMVKRWRDDGMSLRSIALKIGESEKALAEALGEKSLSLNLTPSWRRAGGADGKSA